MRRFRQVKLALESPSSDPYDIIFKSAQDMGQILVRQLDDRVLDALKTRAKRSNRSTEAEARAILSDAVKQTCGPNLAALVGSVPSRSLEDIVDSVRRMRAEWE